MEDMMKQRIAELVDLDQDELSLFSSKLQPRHLKKKEHFIREGERCHHIAFVASGLMYYYLSDEGESKVGQFFFEGQWVADYYSFITQNPSQTNIKALEDTRLLMISYEDLQHLYTKLPKFERLGRLFVERVYVSAHQRNNSFLAESPETRYINLVNERPKVVERVPQYLIASYLGIKPESLSRIRKKIFEKDTFLNPGQ